MRDQGTHIVSTYHAVSGNHAAAPRWVHRQHPIASTPPGQLGQEQPVAAAWLCRCSFHCLCLMVLNLGLQGLQGTPCLMVRQLEGDLGAASSGAAGNHALGGLHLKPYSNRVLFVGQAVVCLHAVAGIRQMWFSQTRVHDRKQPPLLGLWKFQRATWGL